MTPLERVEQASGELKVFPLPNVVLFPHLVVPLHVFEPRYRELVRDALATDGVLAMAQLSPGWQGDYEGRPELEPMVCAGIIVWHEEHADGRYDLLLQGVVRAKVISELAPEKRYREIEAELLPDPPYTGPEEEALRQSVFQLSGGLPPPVAEGLLHLAATSQGGALADVVAGTLSQDPDRRSALFEERDVQRRLREANQDVGELLARMPSLRPPGPLH